MVAKSKRKTLIKKLDTIVSQYVRIRDKRCVICGSSAKLTSGHLWSRIAYSTRWDASPKGNCWCNCWGCNYKHEFDPYPFQEWYRNKFGEKAYNELHRKFNTPVKYSDSDLVSMIENFSVLFNKLNNQ
jgi:hypothetical protein